MNRAPMAHRPTDRPVVTPDDWRALIGLILFAAIFVALTAVES